jgi:hypothetical protein
MEKTLKFNSQIATSRVQSERLLALGLKPETADMSSDGWNDPVVSWGMEWSKEVIESGHLPAWSLHRLLCLYGLDYTIKEVYNNAEECYGMLICAIEIAIEEGYFNKDYLEEKK